MCDAWEVNWVKVARRKVDENALACLSNKLAICATRKKMLIVENPRGWLVMVIGLCSTTLIMVESVCFFC